MTDLADPVAKLPPSVEAFSPTQDTFDNASQVSIPSTKAPNSPVDNSAPSKVDSQDDNSTAKEADVPASLTPPPTSRPTRVASGNTDCISRLTLDSALCTPPVTAVGNAQPHDNATHEYLASTADQSAGASSVAELQAMLKESMAQCAKLQAEAAHHKMQYNFLALECQEDALFAQVEQKIADREREMLRKAETEGLGQTRLGVAISEARCQQLKIKHDEAVAAMQNYRKRFNQAKKLLDRREEEIASLKTHSQMLLNRIKDNRIHFNSYRGPGGIYQAAATRTQSMSAVQHPPPNKRVNDHHHHHVPRRLTLPANHGASQNHDYSRNQHALDTLIQAATHDANNSAPTTPFVALRPTNHIVSRHARAVHSMSSLPTTPISRLERENGGLLPSADLYPRTEPPRRYTQPHAYEAAKPHYSRESTIEAEDTAEIARQAVEAVAHTSYLSKQSARRDSDQVAGRRSSYSRAGVAATSSMLHQSLGCDTAASTDARRAPETAHLPVDVISPRPSNRSSEHAGQLLGGGGALLSNSRTSFSARGAGNNNGKRQWSSGSFDHRDRAGYSNTRAEDSSPRKVLRMDRVTEVPSDS